MILRRSHEIILVGEERGVSLPPPVVLCPFASRLPTPALHCVVPAFRLIKRIRNPGLTFKLCQILTFFNILVHFLAFVLAGGSLGPDESYYRSRPKT